MRKIPILLLAGLAALIASAKTTSKVQLSTMGDSLLVTSVWSYDVVDLYGTSVAVVTDVSPTPIGSMTVPAVMIDNDNTPYPVKYIKDGAFANKLGLTAVILPETLTDLGAQTFKNCTSLKSITLNEGLLRIGKRPFENTALTTLTIPDSLEAVDGNPVAGCKSFLSFSLTDSQSHFSLSGGALYDKDFDVLYSCPARTETLQLADAVTEIGNDAFANCFRLGAVEIPKGVTLIGTNAFVGCSRLTSLTFASSAAPTLLDPNLLADTHRSLVVYVPSESTGWIAGGAAGIDFPAGSVWPESADAANRRTIKRKASTAAGEAFKTTSSGNVFWTYRVVNGTAELMGKNGATAAIPSGTYQTYTWNSGTGQWDPDGRLNVPSSLDGYAVTSIGSNAFLNCSALTTVALPDSITTIGDFAFNGCSSVNKIELPSRVASIGYHAFAKTSLVTLDLPDSLRTLRGNPAAGCDTLLNYTISGNHSYFAVSDNVLYDVDLETLISCPARQASVSIPATVRTIGSEAFRGCFRLTALSLPEALETIEDEAFVDCKRLQELSFSASLTTLVGDGMFDGCAKLVKIAMTGNAPTVSPDILSGTPDTLTIHVGEGTTGWKEPASTDLPDDALWPVGGATRRMIIRDTIVVDPYETSGNWKYRVVDGTVEISGTVTKPTGLITIPDTLGNYPVKTIASGALANCPGLTSITLPSTLTEIGAGAFAGCDALKSITLNYGLRKIGYAAFAGTILQELTIPATVTGIVGNPVLGCDMMQTLTVESGNHAYAASDEGVLFDLAFSHLVACPPNADAITIPNTVVELEDDAFSGCFYLDAITFLGDAPNCVDTIFADTPATLQSLVSTDSTGWGVTIPGTWMHRRIEYVVQTTSEGWSYRILSDYEAEIWSGGTNAITRSQKGALSIPEMVDDYYVTSIGAGALKDMIFVTSFTIPAFVESIADDAFAGCTRLESITVDAGNIDYTAVDGVLYDYDQTELILCPARKTEISVPASVSSIQSPAFAKCTQLKSVTFLGEAPACASTIFADTPADLVSKVSYDTTGFGPLPGTWRGRAVESFNKAPEGLPNVGETFNIDADNHRWQLRLLENCGVEILGVTPQFYGTLIVPATFYNYDTNLHVKAIGPSAFVNMIGLISVTLPDTLLELGDFAFSNCNSLASITLNAGLRTIGKHPFANTALTEIALPDSLMEMDGNIAAGCVNQLTFSTTSVQSHFAIAEDGGLYDKNLTRLYSCPIRQTALSVPATVTTLGDDAFAGCFALKTVTFEGDAPICADTIYADTPTKMQSLVSVDSTGWGVTIPGTWQNREIDYFDYVDPNEAHTTADGWSYRITGTDEAEIWSGDTNAIVRTTSGAVEIPTMVDGYVVTSIGKGALKDLKYVTSITIPASIETIADDALTGCTRLESITVDAGNIDYSSNDGVLYDHDQTELILCPARKTTLTVPDTVTTIAPGALANCIVLEKVTFAGNAPTFSDDLYAATPTKLITAVAAGSTGWKEADSIALPADALWPAMGARRTIVRDVTVDSAVTNINDVTWTYAIEGGEAIITGVAVDGDFDGTLTLPTTLGGCFVTDVAPDAFNDVEGVKAFAVTDDNIAFSTRNGALYSADGTVLVRVPNGFTFASTTTTTKATMTTTVTQRIEDGIIKPNVCVTNKVKTVTDVKSVEPTVPAATLFAGVTRIADGAFFGCGTGGGSGDVVTMTNSVEVINQDSGFSSDMKHTWATCSTSYVITETTVDYVEKLVVPGGVSYSRTRAFAGSNFTEVEDEAPKLQLETVPLPNGDVVSLVCPTVEEKTYTVWKTERIGGTWTKVGTFAGSGEAVEFIDENRTSSAFYKITVETK